MEKVVNLSWGSVLSAICANQTKSPSTKAQKCTVRVLDTVFVDDEASSPEWYFTTKSGIISRKKMDNSSFTNIIDRFARFALANPNNDKQFVGVTHSRTGQRTFWTADDLTTTIEAGLQRAVSGHGNYLQVYLRPHRGHDVCYVIDGKRSKADGSYEFTSSKKTFTTDGGSMVDATVSESIIGQMKTYTIEIVEFFTKHRLLEARHIVAEFIVDDNEHVWLSSMSKLEVVSLKALSSNSLLSAVGENTSSPAADRNRDDLGAFSPPLPSPETPITALPSLRASFTR